jgi:CHASE2 domain-containing sensor protein
VLKRGLKRGVFVVIAVALCASLLALGETLGVVQRPIADLLVRLAENAPPQVPAGFPDVTLVAIDARSLRAMESDWPWPRSDFASVIRRLDEAGARAIALDIDFSAERNPDEDHRLARAIGQSGRVVLTTYRQFQEVPGVGELEIASVPAPIFAGRAARIGAALVDIDSDGLVRRAFRSRSVAGERRQSFSEATLTVALGELVETQQPDPYPIDYRRARPPIPTISIIDVLEGRFDRVDIAGRIVLIGATAAEFQDLWPTPAGPNRPGVWIHAMALRTRIATLAGEPVLARPGPIAQIALICLISLVAAAIGRTRLRWRMLGLTLIGIGVPATSLGVLIGYGLLLDPLLPLAVVGVHYALGLESVRRRLGETLEERDLSLSTLFSVSEASSRSPRVDGLDAPLSMLADVVEASGIALLRTNDNGEIDEESLSWHRRGESVGDVDTATLVLADREMKIFENLIPGKKGTGGGAIYTPLFSGSIALGVLVVERDVSRPLDDTQLRTIATVGTQLALSVQNLRLIDRLKSTLHSSVSALASAVEARDGYTEMHCRRLAVFSAVIADRLGLPAEDIEAIELGALLHDVGKIGVRDDVLLKDGRLTEAERARIEEHPAIGDHIVGSISGISPITVGCVRHHHERWNGTGYPDGLAGEAIPLGARIVALVDVWDALSTPRPYKQAYTQQHVIEILRKDSGVRFEPALVDLFIGILEEQGEEMLDLIQQTAQQLAEQEE